MSQTLFATTESECMVSRREKLEAMLQDSPSDQTLRYMLAMELDKEGDHDRSLELFHGLMQDGVPHVPSFLMAGQQMARLGRTDAARAIYQAGIHQAESQGNSHAAGEMAGFLAALHE
jgi:cytochrome c-type biogenesis protein CcmH/NrfG